MIIILKKIGTEGAFLNIIQLIYNKPTTNSTVNGEKLKAFPLKSGIKQRCHKKRKLQTSFTDEYRYKNPQQNSSKQNPTTH